ncbi:unnamed protein product [Brassica napus]|uniref:(rape) hypothetical protein n=1 Tax=Brassica napus TaxID=3708 RepID=A0A816TC20_BRANA|nr:unnamed protein product [Brassica napus]
MADPLKQICDELGVCKEEALFYLEGFRWDLNAAMEACRTKTLPSPAQPPSSENERTAAEEQRRNDKIARVIVATGATVKEARSYLSRENWNVDNVCLSFSGNEGPDTMHDIFSKVPPFHSTSTNLRIGSPPSASTPPLELKPESIKRFRDVVSDASSQAVIDCLNDCKGNAEHAIQYFYDVYSLKNETPPESLPDEIKEELMASFSSTTGEIRQVAKVYLEQYEWNLVVAVDSFFKHSDSDKQTSALNNRGPPLPTETQKSLEEAGEGDVRVAVPGMASSQVDDKAVEEGSSAETVPDPFANRDRTTVETQAAPKHAARAFCAHRYDKPEKKSKPMPLSHDGGDTEPQVHSTSTNLRIESPPWVSTAPFRLAQKRINHFHDVVSAASSKAVIDCLNYCKGDVDAAIFYFDDVYSKKLPDEIKEELIASFSSTTGETRQVAKVYLEQYMWDLRQAVDSFFEHSDSEKQTSALNNRDPQLEEAGEGDVTVAKPGMASSQADGKAVEEGSSTETVPDPIMITISLADTSGVSLELPFTSDQTVRDIRNAIDQRYPNNDRGYVLESGDGVRYMDWNVTVYRVTRGESTTLFQIYP